MSVLLATSNGTGMGHLARQSAVALELTPPTALFSLSTAVPVVSSLGLAGEYCPSHHRGWMPHLLWHRYLRWRLEALLDELGTRVVAFDGVAPYRGLLRARAARPDVAFVWIRRGLWRSSANRRLLAATGFFDLVIEPGDFASSVDRGPTSTLSAERVGPICVGDAPLSRTAAAEALGLSPDRPAVLVTLGLGTINDVAAPASVAIRAFLADARPWQIVLTRPLPSSALSSPQIRVLQGVYPLSRYLAAFDAAVSAAGYNSFHELLSARVPTLLVPNASTATDDQVARASWAASPEVGVALVADETPESIEAGVRRLLSESCREELRAACAGLPRPSGASEVASRLTGLASREPTGRPRPVRSAALAVQSAGLRVLGEAGVGFARRALGRTADAGPRRRLDSTPVFTSDLDASLLKGDRPVEHVLAGTSPDYRAARVAIARRAYAWTSETS